MSVLAKIAVELSDAVAQQAALGATSTPPSFRALAQGPGWSVKDVTCTYGPHDRPFREEHTGFSIALVLAGTFQYRGAPALDRNGQLMTPGSLMLGNPGQSFECVHEHGHGDRCLSFHFLPQLFEELACDAGARRGQRAFRILRLPAARETSTLAARVSAQLAALSQAANLGAPCSAMQWEELALEMAASSIRLASGSAGDPAGPLPSTAARITRVVRIIDEEIGEPAWTLQRLAAEARLSPYHFLRTFEQVVGVTPHQYVRRARLRRAAAQLLAEPSSVLNIALDCGFSDVSNFNRAFRNEFRVSPRQFRRQHLPPRGISNSDPTSLLYSVEMGSRSRPSHEKAES